MGGAKHSSKLRSQRRNRLKQQIQIDKSQIIEKSTVDQLSENLSFCGCGFLGIYHVGVASCFHEYAPQLSNHKIAGSSAGALVAVAYLCGNLQLASAATDILRVAIEARSRALGPFHPSFDINAFIREALERGLPEDVHEKVSGRLHISLTRVYDGENVIVNQFDSKQEVIQALICSCFIPLWSGLIAPKFRGITYVDGGFSNNLLMLDEKTVTVSPFAGEADICPQDDVYNLFTINLSNTSVSITPHNLYRISHALLPPPPEMLSELCERGFADGIRFLQRMKLISCIKCLEIRSSLLVSDVTHETDIIETTTSTFSSTTSLYEKASTSEKISRAGSYSAANNNNSNNNIDGPILTTFDHSTDLLNSNNYFVGNQMITRTNEDDDYEDEDEAESYYEDDNCDGCILRRKNALGDPLPKLFTDRIRDACDSVNKSLYNWLYSHWPIKYLTYLAAPYYLPMNISLALFLKYWQTVPLISVELVRCVYDLKDLLLEIARRYLEASTTSMLLSSEDVDKLSEDIKQQSSISIKITTDCRESSESSSVKGLTTYECCLKLDLFGRHCSLFSVQK